MKEKSNATLRRAASLRCRTDAAIARLGKAVACYQRGVRVFRGAGYDRRAGEYQCRDHRGHHRR